MRRPIWLAAWVSAIAAPAPAASVCITEADLGFAAVKPRLTLLAPSRKVQDLLRLRLSAFSGDEIDIYFSEFDWRLRVLKKSREGCIVEVLDGTLGDFLKLLDAARR